MTRPAVRLSSTAAVATLALASALALAQSAPRFKPGLWEHSVQRMTGPDGQVAADVKQLQAALADLPPEQRKMMEKMMAEQGVSMSDTGIKGVTQVCLTPEDAKLDELPGVPQGCKQTVTRGSGDIWTVNAECVARPDQPASILRGTFRLQGSTAYSGDYTVTTRGGAPSPPVKMKTEGRWLAAACGDVQPDQR